VKNWRIIPFLLFGLILVLVGSVSCNPLGGLSQTTTQQLVEVKRGDLTVTVSGSGNIEVSNERKLAFSLAGQVEKIYVQEGSEVAQGEKVAQLMTDSLELAVTQAKVAYTQAQASVLQAQLAQQTAEYELEKAQDLYSTAEVSQARAAVREAQSYLTYAQQQLDKAVLAWDITVWTNEVAYAKEKLRAAEVMLNDMLSAPDTKEVAIKRLQVEIAKQSLELAQQSLELAGKSLEQAQKQLDEATLTAPLDGTVSHVYVKEGDTISPAMPIVQIIDLASMQLKVQVDEIDVADVKPGQKAVIELDARPNLKLEGQVNFISFTPTVEGGVVMYDVTVGFTVPENSGLRVGMSATADIITASRSNVLLVPDRAIKQNSQGKTIVEVMVNGQAQERAVVTGISDGLQTEILDGLKEGEVVVVERTQPKSAGTGLF
jgi:RND family efflux transporter MFP subunit